MLCQFHTIYQAIIAISVSLERTVKWVNLNSYHGTHNTYTATQLSP